jgi:hypothetical protein
MKWSVCALAPFAAIDAASATDLLSIHHGTYSSTTCDDAPNAALLDYDGRSLTGAHTSACVTRVLRHAHDEYILRETCPAEQAGGANVARELLVTETLVVMSADSFRLVTDANAGDARTFHRCAKQ